MKRSLLSLLLGLSLLVSAQSPVGHWQFKSILSESGDTLRPVSVADSMHVLENGKFSYELTAVGLLAVGQWEKTGDRLKYSYENPNDTVRFYQLTFSGDSLLTLSENGVDYSFQRASTSASTTALATDEQPGSGAETEPFDTGSFENISLTGILRGLLGLAVLVLIGWLFSSNRRAIKWSLVMKGIGIQLIFAFAILKVEVVKNIFDWMSSAFVTLLSFTTAGSEFIFGSLVTDLEGVGYIFAFQVLPTILFFSALTSILFYYGILQKIVYGFAWLMKRTLKLSGAESLAAAGNIFLGQTESPLLIKPYIDKMTRSELMCLMSGGMATIAGGVLAAYIGFLGGDSDAEKIFFAKHLLAASVMSAPAAIVGAKLLVPETEKFNEEMSISKERIGKNALEAITNGTIQGIRLAVNVGAMLLVFIALIAMVNYVLGDFFGARTGLNTWVNSFTNGQYEQFSLQFILGYVLAPLTWLMGVAKEDMILVGQLLGEKIILNEFVAYVSMGELKEAGKFAEQKSIIIATYILCGFANFASIGIQIGGIGALAPGRKTTLSELGVKALIGGTLASLFTAVIVGMLI
ncbi:MAG: Na+ dependent nucleoside transporter [Flavobacteriales bacterium]|nr:Na+ dependent nucleoside transporter [Flavobacteriales bacterium]